MVTPPDLSVVDESADEWWHDCALRAIEWLAATGTEFDAADVAQMGVPDPDVPARWGAVFQAARRRGVIVPVGYTLARRRARHAGVNRVWIGAEHRVTRAAA